MAPTNAIFHPMLSAAADTAVEASLHTGDPGSTGDAEVSGGEYTRLPVSWQAPADGAIVATDELEFAVPSLGGEVTHVGLWNSNGDWLIDAPAQVPQPFPTPGTATVAELVLDMTTGALMAHISSE